MDTSRGEDGNIDWHVVDDDFNKAAVEMTARFDTMLFGRVTYELFEGFWPTAADDPDVSADDKIIADRINAWNKYVFSRSLTKVTWNNAELVKDDLVNKVRELKAQSGSDIVIYGSGTIVSQLTDAGLIDEYQLMVNPVILGKGKSLFKDAQMRSMKRTGVREFASGNVLLTYEPKK